ncbi:MAG: AsmA-like C-terminal region-containing protein [Cytophagales bacterium]|nr:AsmA-like C-terminal region-containing protein [Cytophagales bacterium]
MNKKIWKRLILGVFTAICIIFGSAVLILVWQQDKIVQNAVNAFNEDFKGAVVIGDSDISPFENFPYISIVIRNVQVFEDQADMFAPILDVSDIYLGFDFWTVLGGDFKVNLLKVENGNFDIVRHTDGSFNLVHALSGEKKIKDIKEEYNIELEKIELSNLDIIKYDEGTRIHAETYIENATAKFKNSEAVLAIALNSQLILNVIDDGDSTVLKKKRFDANTELGYNKETGILTIHPSDIKMKNALLNISGNIDVPEDFDIDIDIHGNNPNFNLLIAFAPEELIPTLEQYDNAGRIYFDATIKGKSLRGQYPAINARFGCDSAYFSNPASNKKLDEISFQGHFTNGANRDLSTMEFVLENITAKPEAGTFFADLAVRNFESPEINMSVRSNFDLDFLAKFLNVTSLENLDGDVALNMKFRDIVDLQNPEKSLEEFSQSYFSELEVRDLTFKIPGYSLSFDSIDIKATMDGNHADIEYIYMNMGQSDLTIRGEIDDLPAIVHQTSDTVNANLFLYSSLLDINELTSNDTARKKPVDEKINNLRLELAFKTAAKSLTNYHHLPSGNFFVKNFYGKLEHYPHTFRKFDAHVIVGDEELDIIDFKGKIDKSDFHYMGRLYDYPKLMQDSLKGSIEIDFSLKSRLLRLHDLFTYRGENYIPKDYREEEIKNLEMYGNAEFEFNDSLISSEVFFDQLNASLQAHDMEIDDVHGKLKFSDNYTDLRNMSGNIGNTSFVTNVNMYHGSDDSIRRSYNRVELYASRVDFDELSNYGSKISDDSLQSIRHEDLYNIYELPFTDLNFTLDVDQMNYHKHLIEKINADFRIQKDHHLYIDTLTFYSSSGHFEIGGYFDGSNSDSIFFYPKIRIDTIDLDQMLYQFDNFGQDYIASDNLIGRLSGSLYGRLMVHANMVPLIDKSEFFMKLEITEGELRNYKPLAALSDYFRDKNLNRIRFDTLSNQLLMSKGMINIPNMTINSSLGFMDITGRQDLNNNMEYYIRVPLKMVTKAARQKLFGKKGNIADSTQIDAIQYKNQSKKNWFINLKIEGNPDNYKISLGKKKKSSSR